MTRLPDTFTGRTGTAVVLLRHNHTVLYAHLPLLVSGTVTRTIRYEVLRLHPATPTQHWSLGGALFPDLLTALAFFTTVERGLEGVV